MNNNTLSSQTNNINNSLSKILMSYNVLLTSIFLFMLLVIMLLIFNPKGFNKTFGYEILITGPIMFLLTILIKELFVFNSSPSQSWFSRFSFSKTKGFMAIMCLLISGIAIVGVYSVLSVAGILSNNPPENNISALINFIIMLVFIGIISFIYTRYKTKDSKVLQGMSTVAQEMFNERTKYTVIFIGYCIFLSMLYMFNPYGIMTNYIGPIMFVSLFTGMVLVGSIMNYNLRLSDQALQTNNLGFIGFFVRGFFILSTLLVAMGLIYYTFKTIGMFNQDASATTWATGILNFIILLGMLGIIYKLINAGGFLDKNPYYRLMLNVIFYIPCLLVYIVNYTASILGFSSHPSPLFEKPKPFEIKMLVFSILLFIGYFGVKQFIIQKYLKQGGTQLLNNPVSTTKLTNINAFEIIGDKHHYQYAISFWTYIDSFPPGGVSQLVPIFSYGGNPTVKYDSFVNTLYVTVNSTEDDDKTTTGTIPENKLTIEDVKLLKFKKELDGNGDRILYKMKDVKLQKWNNIVLNYNGGTLDIFYNGQLVKSAIEVVPYMKFNMIDIGSENGISGNIANVMYFNQPLDILTVNTLYTSLKDISPPTI